MSVTNLGSFKDKKKFKRYIEDLEKILKVIDLAQKGLIHFKHYRYVQEIVSVLETNKTLFDMHKKKYEKALENKLEKT